MTAHGAALGPGPSGEGSALDLAGALAACLAACAAPWGFGAVEPLWWSLAAVGSLGPAFVLLLWRALRGPGHALLPARMETLLLLLPCIPLLTLVPLPPGLVNLLSPASTTLLERAGADPAGGARSLTVTPRDTWHAAVIAGACAASFWLVARAASRPGWERVLAAVVLVGGVALAAEGLVQRLYRYEEQKIYWTVDLSEYGTPFGPYVNRNHFASVMLPFAGLGTGLMLDRWRAGRRVAALAACLGWITCTVALLATTSRGGALGLSVAVCAVILWLRPRGTRFVLALLALGAVLVGGVAATGLLGDLTDRLFRVYGRWRNRFAVQADAWRLFLRFPLFGVGAGGFESAYPPFQTVPDLRRFSSAHSDWLQCLAETGLVGVAWAVAAGWHMLRSLRGRLAELPPLAAGAFAGCLGVVVHGFVESNLHRPANALLFAVTLSLAYAAAMRPVPEEEARPTR